MRVLGEGEEKTVLEFLHYEEYVRCLDLGDHPQENVHGIYLVLRRGV